MKFNLKPGLLCLFFILLYSTEGFGQLFGKSLDFATDGESYVELSGSNDFGKASNFQGAFTFEAWVNAEGSNTWSRVFDFGTGENNTIFFTTKSNTGECLFEYRINGQVNRVYGGEFPAGWNHIAVSLDETKIARIFINGSFAGSAGFSHTIDAIGATNKNYLGKSQFDEHPEFEGKLDEVRIWNDIRTLSEIEDWMTCELSGNEDNLVAYYRFNNGLSTGPNLQDKFEENLGKLSRGKATLMNFSLAGSNGNWVNQTEMSLATNQKNCVEFSNDGFTLLNENKFDFTDAYSIEFWYYPYQDDGITILTIKSNEATNNYPFYLEQQGKSLFFGQRSSTFHNWLAAYNVLEVGKWQHVGAVTYEENGGVVNEIYINGVLKGSKFHPNQVLTQNNEPVTLGYGRNFPGTTRGKMSNVRYWNKRLDDSEIISSPTFNYPPNTPGLVAQYNTFENITQGLVDNSGNNNSGIYFGTPLFSNDPCFVRFTEQPQSFQLSESGGENFSLRADLEECLPIFEYQWQKDGVDIPGATNLEYVINNASTSDLGTYVLNVVACGGQIFSTRAVEITSTNPGTQLSFDGQDDYMEFETISDPSVYTIEKWVRFTDIPQNQNLFIMTNNSGIDEYFSHRLSVNEEGKIEYSVFDSGSNQTRSVTHPLTLDNGTWYHLRASAIAGDSISISINNKTSRDKKAIQALGGGSKIIIGQAACGASYFKGEIDELRIWNSNTNTYFEGELNATRPGLVHYFNFNKGEANGDNRALSTTLPQEFVFPDPSADLYNFAFIGDESNWTKCGPFDGVQALPYRNLVFRELGSSVLFFPGSPPGGVTIESMQWFKDEEIIPSLTSSEFRDDNITVDDAGIYKLKATLSTGCTIDYQIDTVLVNGSGKVLNFDGIDDYVTFEADPRSVFTLMFWAKFEGETSNVNLIQGSDAKGINASSSNQLFTNEDGFLCAYISADGQSDGYLLVSDFQPQENTWHHITLRAGITLGEYEIIFDGNNTGFSTSTGTPVIDVWQGLSQYTMGGSGKTFFPNERILNPFKGEIDDLRIYDRIVPEQEIDDTKDLELYSFEYFICGCVGSNPIKNIQFNQGVADADNSNPAIDKLPVELAIRDYKLDQSEMFNFDFQGPVSNWSDCSPNSVPSVSVNPSIDRPLFGQSWKFVSTATTDTVLLTYQWRKNGIPIDGATFSTLSFSNYSLQDTGNYDLIVFDDCSPQFRDTIEVSTPPIVCFDDLTAASTILIDYPNQTQYSSCTVPFSQSCSTIGFELDKYCDSDLTYPGLEVIYKIEIEDRQVVTLELSNFDTDLDMFLVSGCDLSNCKGSGLNLDLETEIINAELDSGSHYIIIDTKSGITGATTFDLDIAFFDGKCFDAEVIECGESISGNTSTGSEFITEICGLPDYSGGEKIYELTVESNTTLVAELTALDANLDLFLLDSLCQDFNCIAQSTREGFTNEEIIAGVEAGTYYLVVDGFNGEEGSFDLSISCNDYFDVSVDDNDAYIDLTWSIDKKLCVPQDTGVIVRILTMPNTILYEEEFTTAELTPDIISGTFRDYVGTDKSRQYVLRVTNRLSNKTLCNELETGSTTPFQAPIINAISQGTYPDSIRFTWQNKSKLSDQFRIFRDGDLIATLGEGYTEIDQIVSYVDVHNIDNDASIQQNTSYEYCIETFSENLSQSYPQVCTIGNTYNIDFAASDNSEQEYVELTWNDVSDFCDMIKIERNGIMLDILEASQTFYRDNNPLYGINTEYSLTLINGDAETMEVDDTGFVGAIGRISGRVTTDQGDFPVAGAALILTKDTIVEGNPTILVLQNTQSDFKGDFEFQDVVFGLSQDFQVSINKTGSVFDPASKDLTLSEPFPQLENLTFVDLQAVEVTTSTSLIDNFSANILELEDYVNLNWQYTYDPNDTLFFNLYRNGNLIFSATDLAGAVNTYDDFEGVPDSLYVYTLQVTRNSGSGKEVQENSQTLTYPSVSPLTNFDVTIGLGSEDVKMFDPGILLDWASANHPSQNFDGFRIFRDGSSVGETGTEDTEFSHLTPPGSTGGYQIVAFRIVNERVYESEPYPNQPQSITSNNLFEPVFGGLEGRSIELDISMSPGGAFGSEFYGEATYDGIYIERKLQGEDDSTYVRLGEFKKSYLMSIGGDYGNPAFRDVFGIPGLDYDYRLLTYLEIDGQEYLQPNLPDQRTCPSIEAPENIAAVEEEGKVALTWTSNQAGSIQPIGLGYINYEGYELTRTPLGGGEEELIATLKGNRESYNDFISNPVYNIFLDESFNIDYTYSLRAYLDIEGLRYFADALTVDAGPSPGSDIEPLPSNFVASRNLPGQIKLCWEWTASKQSEFVIFRDGELLDILPATARSYYDYNAPVGVDVPYTIQSRSKGVLSQAVRSEGFIPSNISISGRVYNAYSGAGLPAANVTYENVATSEFPKNTFTGSMDTDATGNYHFEGIPNIDNMQFLISVNRINADFLEDELLFSTSAGGSVTIDGSTTYVRDFIDYSAQEEGEEIAQVIALSTVVNDFDINVRLNWSLDNMNYDGVKVYRADKVIAEIAKGEGSTFVDDAGFPGITYPYGVIAYKDTPNGRRFTSIRSKNAEFPAVLPVVNLTATAFAAKNLMKIAWSHPVGNIDSYSIARNGVFQVNIPGDQPLMWYDSTGLPGVTYQYEVIAIKDPFTSVPVAIEKRYKGVGEVSGLSTSIDQSIAACQGVSTNDNRVSLFWTYMPEAADGFEVYRDGQLIAEIDSTVLSFGNKPLELGDTLFTGDRGVYYDYTGTPGVLHEYHVLAYVERGGSRQSSGVEELFLKSEIVFPEIAQVRNLSIEANDFLGSVQISFMYESEIVDGFELLKGGIAFDTINSGTNSSYVYQDFNGVPGQVYEYDVRVIDYREDLEYSSTSSCAKNVTFPIVPVPSDFEASQGTFLDYIEISWNFSLRAAVDHFHLENLTLGTVKTFESGRRKFTDVVNEFTDPSFQYRIRASREFGGNIIFSDWSPIVTGFAKRQINGEQSEVVVGDNRSNSDGYTVAIDGDWAASTAINGEEVVNVYLREEGGWNLYQQISYPGNDLDTDFGFALAINDGNLVISAPKLDEVFVYKYNGASWTNPQLIKSTNSTNSFGHAVDISGDQLIIGDPLVSNGSVTGQVVFYKLLNGLWTFETAYSEPGATRLGYGVAIDGDQALAAYHLFGSLFNEAITFVKSGNNWNKVSNTLRITGFFPGTLRDPIDLDQGKVVFGDPAFNSFQGRMLTADLSETGIVSNQSFFTPQINQGSNFGVSVGIRRIPSPDNNATYILVGSPSFDLPSINAGKALLFSDITGSYQVFREFQSGKTGDEYGFSVGLSRDAVIMGVRNHSEIDIGKVEIVNLIDAPTSVEATDGVSVDLDPNRTTVSWLYEGDKNLFGGVNIYRDEEFLIYRSRATMTEEPNGSISGSWDDNSGGTGQEYIYSVRSVNQNIPFESYGTADLGSNTASGRIQGRVVTAGNSIPIPGVTIKAVGIVEGEVYEYSAVTFSDGQYVIPNVYFDHDPNIASEYELTASLQDNDIVAEGSNIAVLNSLLDPTIGVVDFVDNTAFVVFGNFSRPGLACPPEGLSVTPVVNGVPRLLSATTTDADGNYSVVVNPNDPLLNELTIRIENQLVNDMDTIAFGFLPDADTLFTDFTNFPQATEINFVDSLTYAVNLRVKNTCDDPISSSKWTIRVRTEDGCFDQSYQTNSSGDLTVNLLPLKYTMTVVESDVATSTNQVALDYFANFPVSLDLLQIHKDSFKTASPAVISDLASRDFIYHVAPSIEITGFPNFLCDLGTAVLQQGDDYTLNIDVSELFGDKNCSVREGKLLINNPAASNGSSVAINYDEEEERFPEYTFTAGDPNQISPYFHTMTIDYLSDNDVFLGRLSQLIFVEGAVALPGTGIIVNPVDGNDAVPLPLLVLRDPPGDGSSSYISSGQSISYSTEYTKSKGGEASVTIGKEIGILGQDVKFGLELTSGGSDEQTNTYESTLTLSQTISTSDDESLVGVDADIVVGEGLVMSYGQVIEYSLTDCDEITRNLTYSISPDEITTTFFYTVSQIKDVILGYQNDSIQIRNGDLILTERGVPLTRAESQTKINTYIDNWRKILEFHSRQTLPTYNLCTQVPPINFAASNIGNDPLGNIELWKSVVCQDLGTGLNETFEPFDNITWNENLIDKYNAASIAIRNIARGSNPNNKYNYGGNIQGTLAIAAADNEFGLYGLPVENITVGGGVTVERSINNVNASTRTNSSSFFFKSQISAETEIGEEVEVVVGGFAGAGIGAFAGIFAGKVQTLGSIKAEIGVTGTFEYSSSNSGALAIENEVETGYTLFDDDIEDAFSVTVIQPISQNQTPYFEFFGGFTSCPPEEGAINIDNPVIGIVQGGGTTKSLVLQNVDPSEAASIGIRVDNLTPIPSQPSREVKISLDPASNTNGALVTLNGVDLNNGSLVLTLDAFDPRTLSLSVEKGPLFFEYNDLRLIIEPTCSPDPSDEVFVSVRFTNPCSPVTLVEPSSGWLINDDVSKLVVGIQDYDPDNEVLEKAILEYRKLGTGDNWDLVNDLQLLEGNEISAATLGAYNAGLDNSILNPKYFFIWTIPDDFTDGQYEIRVRMKCDFSNTYSNTVVGTLARQRIGLFGLPQPSDQVWTNGDEISFSFNLPLDCSEIQGRDGFIEDNICIVDETTGEAVAFSVSCFNNKLQFVLLEPMATYDGHFLTMKVNEIPSTMGNISETHEWTFRVITQKVYWANGDTIKLRLYEGESEMVTARLINTDGIPIGADLSFTEVGPWLSVINPSSEMFDLSPEGRSVDFEVTANVPLGKYVESIEVEGLEMFGNPPVLNFQLEVLNRPPNWIVNPDDFSESMNLLANWKFDDEDDEAISMDTSDIISVWVGSEIRGRANIQVSDGFKYAFITVYGRQEDGTDTPLEFRIWDGDPGTEYDGHPSDTIFYRKDAQQGTVGSPRILSVNRLNDLARYIPLKGNGNWTGISLFTETENMTVANKLRSLKDPQRGDILLTADKFSQYNELTGWFNFGSEDLTEVNTSRGYMIYLQGMNDTLRVTGGIAMPENIPLKNGWNWLGFPFEESSPTNFAFEYPAANGLDRLKKDTPLPDEMNQSAIYNPGNDSWQGNLPNMEPNNLYKLFVSNPNASALELTWTAGNIGSGILPPQIASLGLLADPNDQQTWGKPDFTSDAVMPVIAQVIMDGQVEEDPLDQIAIFEDDTLRAYGKIEYLEAFDSYQVSLLVEEAEGTYDIRFYDASEDLIFASTNSLLFNRIGAGTFNDPYPIQFEPSNCPQELILGPELGIFDVSTLYEAGQRIIIRGNHTIPAGSEIRFNAPDIQLEGDIISELGSNILISPQGCND